MAFDTIRKSDECIVLIWMHGFISVMQDYDQFILVWEKSYNKSSFFPANRT